MQSPSATGSETISKLSPYILTRREAPKPSSLMRAQLSGLGRIRSALDTRASIATGRLILGAVTQSPDLPSLRHPANKRSGGKADCKGCRNRQHKMSLDTPSGIVQEFFGSIAAFFCRTLRYSYAIFYRIGNRAGYPRSLVSCFGDV